MMPGVAMALAMAGLMASAISLAWLIGYIQGSEHMKERIKGK